MAASETFEFEWEHPGDAALSWRWDNWHYPRPVTLLSYDLTAPQSSGQNRAFAAMGAPIAVERRRVNGYYYRTTRPRQASDPSPLDPLPQPPPEKNHEAWDTAWLPAVQGYLKRWEAFDREHASAPALADHIEASLQWAEHCWEIHFRLNFGLAGWMGWCENALGWSGERARELSAGLMNKSIESDDVLRGLAATVQQSESLRRVFALPAREILSGLPADEAGAAFRARLHEFLDRFGRRSEDEGEFSIMSWREDPTPVVALIKAYAAQPRVDFVAQRAERERRRSELEAQAREEVARAHPELVARFDEELQRARRCAVLTEDHNYWIDQQSGYWARMNALAAGRHLVALKVIDRDTDVFDLSLSEVLNALRGEQTDLRATVTERRAERERWERNTPPVIIGSPLPEQMAAALEPMFGNSVDTSNAQVVRGQPASKGIVTGRARIVTSLDEAGRLLPGDILVTKTTSPPWTPIFGLVAGIVTDAGGALSHAAVVAREYGIPAVVGTVSATERIRDGQMIRVDGGAGTVELTVSEG